MDNFTCKKMYTYTVNLKDCYDNVAPYGVLNIFQDVASKHVEEYGYGFLDLYKLGYLWILVRTKYEVKKSPKPNEEMLIAETWQLEQGRADFTRDYVIYSKDGEVLIIGTSKWCLIDVNTRRVAPTKVIGTNIVNNEKRNFSESFRKLEFENITSGDSYLEKVTFSKVDHNGHMNNAYYAEFIVNALRLKSDEVIKNFEIDYLKEALIDDEILIRSIRNNKEILVEGYNNINNNIVLFKAKIELF